jgi:hypothetical protein
LFAISPREVVVHEEIRSSFFRGIGGAIGWKHKTVSFEQPSKFILLLILLGISFYGRGFLFLISRRGGGGFDGAVFESLGCTGVRDEPFLLTRRRLLTSTEGLMDFCVFGEWANVVSYLWDSERDEYY